VADPFGFHDLAPGAAGDDDGAGTGGLSRAARLVGGVGLAVVLVAVAVAGAAGLLVSLSAVAVLTTLVLALRTPGAPPPPRRRRPGPRVENAPFRAYRQVAEALSWAAVSPRHYDVVTRPLLTGLAASRLQDRHRVDLYADPAAARAVLGAEVWQWVDPDREPSRDSQPPGIDRATLARIVERLERL
jgi:hypothetical protein